jgi:hypothetical protein
MIKKFDKFSRWNTKFTHFENFIFIQQWLIKKMWFIGATICIFNNMFQNISFKDSFIWKNEKGLKRFHSLFVINIVQLVGPIVCHYSTSVQLGQCDYCNNLLMY